jgi:hypothetical protein
MKIPRGEDITLKFDGGVLTFRPVKIYSEDYAAREYRTTLEALNEFVQKANKELDGDRQARRLGPFTGKLKRG